MKVVILSAVRTGRLDPSRSLSRPQVHSAAGNIMPMKIPMTPSGIEPATFQLVAQCFNQLRHHVTNTVNFLSNKTVLAIFKFNFVHFWRNCITLTKNQQQLVASICWLVLRQVLAYAFIVRAIHTSDFITCKIRRKTESDVWTQHIYIYKL